MREIRLHGRGGQGAVRASEILVSTVVAGEGYAQFIPFFGVERKGSPVYGFVRFDDKPIRPKHQVYYPHAVMCLDDTLLGLVDIYEGLRQDGLVIINSRKSLEELLVPDSAAVIGVLDASAIARQEIGRDIPNTVMLGAFARITGWVDPEILYAQVEEAFGSANMRACQMGYANVIRTERGAAR